MTLEVSKPTWMVAGEQETVINSTTNYDRFNFDPSNRPVDEKHVAELVEAIKAKNLLREYPIVVDEHFKLLDGQHRLRAAQRIGVPIYFIVSKQMTVRDVASANHHQEEWKMENYMHHWCQQGNESYKVLKSFTERYPFISPSICLYILSGASAERRKLFNDGRFQVVRLELAEKVAAALIDFQRHTDICRNFKFINAVTCMVANPKYDHRHMMLKLEYLNARLKQCVTTKESLDMLSGIYNYKTREADRVEFKTMLGQRKTAKKG